MIESVLDRQNGGGALRLVVDAAAEVVVVFFSAVAGKTADDWANATESEVGGGATSDDCGRRVGESSSPSFPRIPSVVVAMAPFSCR